MISLRYSRSYLQTCAVVSLEGLGIKSGHNAVFLKSNDEGDMLSMARREAEFGVFNYKYKFVKLDAST